MVASTSNVTTRLILPVGEGRISVLFLWDSALKTLLSVEIEITKDFAFCRDRNN